MMRRPAVAVLAAIVLGVLLPACTSSDDGTYKLTAYFDKGISLYSGGDVRVLGLPAGEIKKVAAEPNRVRVDMVIKSDVPVPKGITGIESSDRPQRRRGTAETEVGIAGVLLCDDSARGRGSRSALDRRNRRRVPRRRARMPRRQVLRTQRLRTRAASTTSARSKTLVFSGSAIT